LAVAALVAAVVAAAALDARRAGVAPVATREVPATVARTVPAPYRAAVSHPAGLAVRVRQAVPAGLRLDPSESDGDLVADLVGQRRGTFRLPPLDVRVRGPLGLARRDHRVGDATDVEVIPDVVTARRVVAERRLRNRGSWEGRTRGPLGMGTDFASLRDWQPDDDIRALNWRATARAGRPVANQFRVDQDQAVTCLVDAGRLMTAPLGDGSRLDAALDAVAVVAATAEDVGDRVGVVAFADRVLRRLPPRRAAGRDVVRVVSDLAAEAVDSDYELAFRVATSTKRGVTVVFTDLLDEAAAGSLIRAVPVLRRRHAVIVATARDPDVARAATTMPETPFEVYAAVVAGGLDAERARAVAALRHAGAVVVEAVAKDLGVACADAYLRLKARAAA
jgi:uncharacterized protein (DUF58 family)